jgi:hypothetical protein
VDGWLSDFERLDDDTEVDSGCVYDPPENSKTKMFPESFAKEHIELNWGNSAATRELWYYAAAIVIAPAPN